MSAIKACGSRSPTSSRTWGEALKRRKLSGTRAALWIVTVLALAGSAYTVHGPGLLFLPAVLVLCLANYASLACRLVEWRQARALRMPRTEARPEGASIAGPSPAVAGEGTADIAAESAERPLSA